MSKKCLIFSTILLLAILSVSFLSVSFVNTNNVVENGQNDDNSEISLNPKSSAYDVSEKWNKTTGKIVKSVALSADGKYMVAGTDIDAAGDEIFFFNTSDHEGIPMWGVNTADNINEVAISGTGKYIAVAGDNYALLFNSTPSAGNIPMWNVSAAANHNFESVDISVNGEYIVLGHRATVLTFSEVYLYNNSYSTNKVEMWYQLINNKITTVAISADGNYIAVGAETGIGGGGSQGQLTSYNNTNPTSMGSGTNGWMWFYKTASLPASIEFSVDGKYLVAGGTYDVGQPEWPQMYYFKNFELSGHIMGPTWHFNITYDVNSVAISADGTKIVAGAHLSVGNNNLFYFNNTPTKKDDCAIPEWSYKADFDISSVDMTADGSYVVAGLNLIAGDTIVFFNNSGVGTKTPEWSLSYSSSLSPFLSVSISSWGNYIGAGGGPGGFGKAFLFYHALPNPVLTSGSVDPKSGDQYTQFTFSVNYTHLDDHAPIYVNVTVNGTSYEMYKQYTSDDVYTDGCIYNRTITLAPAAHNYTYYFKCSDGYYTNTTSIYDDLEVINVAPVLTSGSLDPKSGDQYTQFTFTVNYTDQNNDTPYSIYVVINGTSYEMYKQEISDNDYTDGCIYNRTITLAPAVYNYTYYFECSDGYATNTTSTNNNLYVYRTVVTGDDEEGAIPFGNHYLLFAAIAIASLVIITKRKAVFSKK